MGNTEDRNTERLERGGGHHMPTIQAERHATLAAALQELVGSGVNGAAGQVVAAEGGAGHQGRHLGHLGAARQVQGGVAELHQAGVRQPGAGGQEQWRPGFPFLCETLYFLMSPPKCP